ncbi:MAG: ribonuclease III [Chloroflexi bacterium]|nr:ribonuclease III [Chloroflexota bacterium]MBI3732490.1 ribonuclease III [Chloroflexota bacterium]
MTPDDLEAALGLAFADKSLLIRALTHRSHLNESSQAAALDNERLEFLGDAVLDFLTGEWLYHRYPEMREGELTNLRSALVKRETLARFAADICLGDYLLVSKGERAAGGHQRVTLLAGAFEALVGALYLDGGLANAKQFWDRFAEPHLLRIMQDRLDKDAKSLLQELSQGVFQAKPIYQLSAVTGPDHDKEFDVQVLIGGRVMGTGHGHTKQGAEQEAARGALQVLEAEGYRLA